MDGNTQVHVFVLPNCLKRLWMRTASGSPDSSGRGDAAFDLLSLTCSSHLTPGKYPSSLHESSKKCPKTWPFFTTRFIYSRGKKTLKRLEVHSSLEADQIGRGFKIKAQHNTTWDFQTAHQQRRAILCVNQKQKPVFCSQQQVVFHPPPPPISHTCK